MAVLATVKHGLGKALTKAADKGGNLIAKASGLTSAQLDKIEKTERNISAKSPNLTRKALSGFSAPMPLKRMRHICRRFPLSIALWLSTGRTMKLRLKTVSAILKSPNGFPTQPRITLTS